MIKKWVEKIVDHKIEMAISKAWDSDRIYLEEMIDAQLKIKGEKLNKNVDTWIDTWNGHLKETKENTIRAEKHNRLIEGWLRVFMKRNGIDTNAIHKKEKADT